MIDQIDSSGPNSKLGKDLLNRNASKQLQIPFDKSYNGIVNAKLMKTANSFFQKNDQESQVISQFGKVNKDINHYDDKLYYTANKNTNKLVLEPIIDQKVLPPLKHKPKKFLSKIHGYLEQENIMGSISNINPLLE